MAYNSLEVNEAIQNVGQKYAPKEKLARTIKIIATPKSFQFATMADALDETKWQALFEQEADRGYVLPYFYAVEDASTEATMEEFTGGDSLEVDKGKYAETGQMYVSVGDMVKLSSFNNQDFRYFEIDANGNILGTSPDGVVLQGFEATEFVVGKMNRTAGDVNRKVPLFIKGRDVTEWTDKGVALQPLELETNAFDPRDFDGLTDVELTIVSAIATKIVVKAEAYLKGVLIKGLDQTIDWLVKDGAGAAQVITVTDNLDGTYDLDGIGFVSGFTVNLNTPSNLTLDGYESTGAKTITV